MNKRKKSKLGLIITVALAVYFIFTIINQQKIINNKKVEMSAANDRYKKETQLNESLKKEKDILNSNEYAERIAREELGMVKQGEKVFVDINK